MVGGDGRILQDFPTSGRVQMSWFVLALVVFAGCLFLLVLIVCYVGLERARSDNRIDHRFSKRTTGKITEQERSNLSIRPDDSPHNH